MKTATTLLVLAALVLGAIALRTPEPDAAAPAPAAEPRPSYPVDLAGEVPDGCVVRTLALEGVCCAGCGAKLHAALAAVAGVREAAVDADALLARALVPTDLDVTTLERALTFDDYAARAVE